MTVAASFHPNTVPDLRLVSSSVDLLTTGDSSVAPGLVFEFKCEPQIIYIVQLDGVHIVDVALAYPCLQRRSIAP